MSPPEDPAGRRSPLGWVGFLFKKLFLDQWRAIDQAYREQNEREQAREQAAKEPSQKREAGKRKRGKRGARAQKPVETATVVPSYDWRPLVILIIVAVSLTLQEYYGERKYHSEFFPYDASARYWQLGAFAWWSGWRVFGYVVIPVVAILLMPGERLRDYYVSPKGFFKHLWIYVVLYLMILPAVFLASRTSSFAHTYPFYKLANRSSFDFWAWEGMYAVQFLALEFFFRGFILHGLRRTLGSKAIFVMIVPYCMIHYGKPFPETMGAIFAGIILGTLAMRTRSIWGGVAIHVCVAVTMDVLALGHCPSAETGLPCRGH